MLKNVFEKLFSAKIAYAHCDIPCGIYDPYQAQIAAHTIIRMTSLINDAKGDAYKISRCARVKDEHAEILKNEVRVIWGDYFKPEMVEKYPDLHETVFKIMKLASKARQEVDLGAANELLAEVQKFAETFYQSKGLEIVRIKSSFPTEGEIVSHK